MKRHSLIKKYTCTVEWCTESFLTSYELKTHTNCWHTEKGQQARKKQEHRVALALEKAEIVFDREQRINYACVDSFDKKYARIDFVIYTDRAIFLLEVDEHQHNTRSQVAASQSTTISTSAPSAPWSYTVGCDMARMGHVQAALVAIWTAEKSSGLPIVWLRYNPNSCYVDGVLQKVLKRVREEKLVDLLTNFKPTVPLTIMYLYYDCHTDSESGKLSLDVVGHCEYDANMAKCVVDPVV